MPNEQDKLIVLPDIRSMKATPQSLTGTADVSNAAEIDTSFTCGTDSDSKQEFPELQQILAAAYSVYRTSTVNMIGHRSLAGQHKPLDCTFEELEAT
jgi:hypothetical protein